MSSVPHLRRSRTFVATLSCAIIATLCVTAMLVSKTADASAGTRSVTVETIYVSPSGSDSNPGTQAKPLKTLIAARNHVRAMNRAMRTDITISLAPGTYRLTSPLALGPQDSGFNGHSVIWSGPAGKPAIVAGSRKIVGWRSMGGSLGIWRAAVPSGSNFRQLYVNGQRASLASGPVPVQLTETSTGYRASSSMMAKWRNPSDIDFVYTAQLGLMVEPICPVGSIHGATIQMAQPCWGNSNERTHNIVGFGILRQPSYVENAYELLRQPGQFYLDRTAHKLYYIPRPGQNMASADVEAPVLQALIAGSGSPSEPIHNITFKGIQFSYATWLQPGSPTGLSDMQDGFSVTGKHGAATEGLCGTAPHGTCPFGNWTPELGNITFTDDQNVSFTGDQFVHLGGAGLTLGDGTRDDLVSGSVFTDISGNGLQLGGVDKPTAPSSQQTLGNRIVDNHLYGVPAEYHGGVALWVGYAAHTLIAHNQVDHVPYSGISLGWGGWPDKIGKPAVANYSRDNVVSDNKISNFMQTLSDGGGVYTLGITGTSLANGEKVTGNVIHDQLAWGRALQNDDGATFVTYRDNVLWNNSYDYGTVHVDFSKHQDSRCVSNPSPAYCTYDPASVSGNYWQQGDPSTQTPGVNVSGNTLISDGNMAPSAVTSAAGIPSSFGNVLAWRPAGESYPDAPYEVSALYAYSGKAYVTWRPSYLLGDPSGYTVLACPASGGLVTGACSHPAARTSISGKAFGDRGYAVVSGLHAGSGYGFEVVANVAGNESTPSIPSPVVTVSSTRPSRPTAPRSLDAMGGNHLVRLIWYAPSSSAHAPTLGYTVTQTGGSSHVVTGLRPLIVSNSGGRVVFVVSNLTPGKSYSFAVSALGPSGSGPAASFPKVEPTG